jgi:hypothetical protein
MREEEKLQTSKIQNPRKFQNSTSKPANRRALPGRDFPQRGLTRRTEGVLLAMMAGTRGLERRVAGGWIYAIRRIFDIEK